MWNPISSWRKTRARLGFPGRGKYDSPNHLRGRPLRFKPLEPRHLLSADVALSAFYGRGEDLVLTYEVAEEQAEPFNIDIYGSLDGLTPDWQLASRRVSSPQDLSVGVHAARLSPEFNDPRDDYFLLAQIHVPWYPTEQSGLNHDLLFQGGAFQSTDGTLHIHGTSDTDALELHERGGALHVTLNGTSYGKLTDYSAVHIRTHGEQDSILVEAASTPVWAFGGYGAELLVDGTGEALQTVVRGGQSAGGSGAGGAGTLHGGDPAGDLDPTFDADGRVLTNFGSSDQAQAVAVQLDGKIVVAGNTWGGNRYYDFAVARYNSNGSLDDGGPNDTDPNDWFGTGGKVTTDFGGSNDYAWGLVLQPDGETQKIVVVGYANMGANLDDFALVRYLPDGQPDESFGPEGKRTTDFFGGSADHAFDVALQGDGKLVVAGYAYHGDNSYDFALARYLSNGELDGTFDGDGDTDGKITTDFGSYGVDVGRAVAIQADGKIVVAGYAPGAACQDFAVARYNSNGSLDDGGEHDTTPGDRFGTDGKATVDFDGGYDYARDVALQSEGEIVKIVLAGAADMGATSFDFALARWLPSGQLDGTFDGDGDNDGKITTDFVGATDHGWGLAISPDGKMVVSGYAYNVSNSDFALARYNPNGSLDDGGQYDTTPGDTFGEEGRVLTDVPVPPGPAGAGNLAYGCTLQEADNKILMAGWALVGQPASDFMVARYMPGDPDIQITGFRVDPNDPTPEDPTDDLTHLEVAYRIWNSPVDDFHIAVYASFNAQTPETLLINHFPVTNPADRTVGNHTLSIPALFLNQGPSGYDLELDYFLMAKVDSSGAGPNGEIAETNEANNTRLFDGGIFRDPGTPEQPHKIVHVHGVDARYPEPGDEPYDERDIARLEQDAQYYYVYLNHPDDFDEGHPALDPEDPDPPPLPDYYWAQYAKGNVSQFHIRTHNGNDDVLTPRLEYDDQRSFIAVPIWAFGGHGDDVIYGGDAEELGNLDFCDRLYAGAGDDYIAGRRGPDRIYGEDGNDTLEGWAGRDSIYGGAGNDRIEGWSGADLIYGDEGDDIITGGLDDTVEADSGDEIHGGPGNDRMDGWRDIDYIYGDEGDDEIYGGTGCDWVYGGPGNDNLFGEGGQDHLFGGDGDDFLYGGPDGASDCDGEDGDDFIAENDLSNWPNGLPWPELNLFAETNEVGDDKGPNWIPTGPLAGQWDTEDATAAYRGSQHVFEVNNPDPQDPNAANWFGGVWANEPFKIYVTWAPRPEDGAENAPFYVLWFGATPIRLGPFTLNQQLAPTAYPNGIWIDNQYFAPLDAWNPQREFEVDGALWVRLTDRDVPSGQFIIADAIVFRRVNDEDPELPGSHANREENGFYTGLVLQASSVEEPVLKRVELAVEGPTGSLSDRHLQLDFDPAVIRVYRYADGTGEIFAGQTLLDIFELDEIFIRGVAEGSTDLVLTLDEPLNGRPLSDLVVVNVWE